MDENIDRYKIEKVEDVDEVVDHDVEKASTLVNIISATIATAAAAITTAACFIDINTTRILANYGISTHHDVIISCFLTAVAGTLTLMGAGIDAYMINSYRELKEKKTANEFIPEEEKEVVDEEKYSRGGK